MDDLIGKTFEEVGHCYGLCRLVCKRMGIEIPNYRVTDDAIRNGLEIQKAREWDQWAEIKKPQAGDVVAYRMKFGFPTHVGVMINEHEFLHALENVGVVRESILASTWKRRVVGFYRWIG
jgi:cell wall-associated NlpC family hydrolase